MEKDYLKAYANQEKVGYVPPSDGTKSRYLKLGTGDNLIRFLPGQVGKKPFVRTVSYTFKEGNRFKGSPYAAFHSSLVEKDLFHIYLNELSKWVKALPEDEKKSYWQKSKALFANKRWASYVLKDDEIKLFEFSDNLEKDIYSLVSKESGNMVNDVKKSYVFNVRKGADNKRTVVIAQKDIRLGERDVKEDIVTGISGDILKQLNEDIPSLEEHYEDLYNSYHLKSQLDYLTWFQKNEVDAWPDGPGNILEGIMSQYMAMKEALDG